MINIIWNDWGTEQVESADNREVAEAILSRRSYCNRTFWAYVLPAAHLVRFQELRTKDKENSLTEYENNEFDSLYIGFVIFRKTTSGAKGVRKAHWKWNIAPRWSVLK